ncbi:REP-associated tyrosine transposase [Roseateles saccharophilus]|uniref:Putative transposase n=1 Tax=Roseateles saccharophilus TaxID=304 RepID=A0A4R3UK82_ROSSA|nr:transposase [Roseateles saccharophilus]MDG0834092.1 transposase [Roseateles saccharophilus]TCU90820.1 putative transposase [Roseateles saccharophilus]
MARLPRLILAGQPHHVILRGNNRQAIFFSDLDRQQLLATLAEVAAQYRIAIHAYVLMDNHLHLLLTPSAADDLSRMMQSLGRRYVGWFNARHKRSGTLWEGRFRAGLIEGERHLLACMRYIELNPVRAGLCAEAAQWPWSSAAHHLGLTRGALVTEHEMYWSLGNTPFEREHAYREFLANGVSLSELADFTDAALRGRPVASEAFLKPLAADHEAVIVRRPRGRPRKSPLTTAQRDASV